MTNMVSETTSVHEEIEALLGALALRILRDQVEALQRKIGQD